MHRSPHIRRTLVAVAVILLLTATFAASVCHDHHGTSETTCQICHVGHQPMDQHLVSNRLVTPLFVAAAQLAADPIATSGPELRISASRAPPLS